MYRENNHSTHVLFLRYPFGLFTRKWSIGKFFLLGFPDKTIRDDLVNSQQNIIRYYFGNKWIHQDTS